MPDKKEPSSTVVSTRLPAEEYFFIKRMAELEECTISEYLRALVVDDLVEESLKRLYLKLESTHISKSQKIIGSESITEMAIETLKAQGYKIERGEV